MYIISNTRYLVFRQRYVVFENITNTTRLVKRVVFDNTVIIGVIKSCYLILLVRKKNFFKRNIIEITNKINRLQ